MILPENIRDIYAKATCVFTKEEVETAISQMAKQIENRFANTNPVFICVVIGGMIPLSNILLKLNFPLEVDYAHVSRYKGEEIPGEMFWYAKPVTKLTNRTVIIVDDILDGGITIATLKKYCHAQGAKDVFTAVLLDKHKSREKDGLQKADITGLIMGDQFVFGYGLDYHGYLRNVPGIYVVAPEHAK